MLGSGFSWTAAHGPDLRVAMSSRSFPPLDLCDPTELKAQRVPRLGPPALPYLTPLQHNVFSSALLKRDAHRQSRLVSEIRRRDLQKLARYDRTPWARRPGWLAHVRNASKSPDLWNFRFRL